ncbi:MAG: hypothetical protein HY300_07525 [Verrucomicrobia bacterium]|nr:hypothetical protein [Verrucomicrobiota bacterium]
MFGTIRKHSRWLWAIIITIIIVSFVIFFMPDAKLGIEKKEKEFTHLLLTEELKLNKIEISDALVAADIRNSFRDRDNPGKFDPQNYFNFIRRELNPAGVSQEDFERFLRHDLGRRHLGAVFGMSGSLVTARAAEAFFRRENEQVVTEAVFLHDTNYVNAVVVQPGALAQFFTNQLATYKIRERVQVSYVAFANSNYFAEADKVLAANTNLAARIEAEFASRGTNALRDAEGKPLAADEAKKKISDEFRRDIARTNAAAAATAFANELYKMQPASAANLPKLAAAKGLPVLDSGPFDDLDGPASFSAPRLFTRIAFTLSEDTPISPTIPGDDAVYLLALKRRLPAENPSFESVKDKVTADYRRAQSHEQCMQAARAAMMHITNSLAGGKSFKDAAALDNLKAVEIPALTRRLRQLAQLDDQGVELNRYREVAFSLGKGRVSQPDTTFGGAYIFYVKDVVPVSEEKLRADLPAFTDELRESRMNYAFNEWLNREAERSGIFAGRQQQQGEGKQPPLPAE